jgi:hypothetical protein
MKEVTQLAAQSNGPISGVDPNEVAAVTQGMTNFLNSVKAKVDQVAQGAMMDNISQKAGQEFNMGQTTAATMGAMEMMGQAVKGEFQAKAFESTNSALAVASQVKMETNNASTNTMQQEQFETANFDANTMAQANSYGAQANAMAQVNTSATNQAMNQMANYQAQAKKMF